MIATFHKSHKRSEDIATFSFRPHSPMHFTAGQFVELIVKHDHPDSRGQKRWFTISSSPKNEYLNITTRKAPDKSSSYKQALWKLKPGDEVVISDPMGDFVMPKLNQTPLIFVAAGIGITPFISMLEWLIETGEERPIRLLHGVRTEDDIIFQDAIHKSKIHTTYAVSEPSSAWGGERGRITAEMILGIEKPDESTLIYVSGPERMVESLEKDLKKAGIKPSQLVLDFFPNYESY